MNPKQLHTYTPCLGRELGLHKVTSFQKTNLKKKKKKRDGTYKTIQLKK